MVLLKMIVSITLICSMCVMLAAVYPLSASAENCSLEKVRQAEMDMRRAEETGRATKLKEAFEMALSLNTKCLMGDGISRQKNLKKRLGLKLGEQEEKYGRFDAAYQWYESSGNTQEAERIKLKQFVVGTNENNHNVQSHQK